MKIVDKKDYIIIQFEKGEKNLKNDCILFEYYKDILTIVKEKKIYKLIIDFANIEYISSLGYSNLYKIKKEIMKNNGRLILINFNEFLQNLNKLVQIERLFQIKDSLIDAEKSILSKKRIVFIDDEISIRKIYQNIFEENNYEIHLADNGKAGLELIEKYNPDLVITDIIMPEMDGIEVIKYLNDKYPYQRIIAMSGGGKISADNYLKMAEKLNVNKIIKKPFSVEEILHTVKSII